MVAQLKNRSMFIIGQDSPDDLLGNAANVIRFLSEVTESMVGNQEGRLGLSKTGALGLYLILKAVENTINEAKSRIKSEN